MALIKFPVGLGKTNRHEDVKQVQRLLNLNKNRMFPVETLTEDGFCGPKTRAQIGRFQRSVMFLPLSQATGYVGPDDATYNGLCWGAREPWNVKVPQKAVDMNTSMVVQQKMQQAQQKTSNSIASGPKPGINPITGAPGFEENPIQVVGHLRVDIKGDGRFNARRHNKSGHHNGIDIVGVIGYTPILAHRDGTLISHGITPKKGGAVIAIDHGNIISIYCHCHIPDFYNYLKDKKITQGQRIATVGNSGNAGDTTPHLHFAVKYGQNYIDPAQYLNGIPPKGCKTMMWN